MNIKCQIAMFVLISLMATTNAFAVEKNTKYQDVFYPNGMPVKKGWFGTGPSVYKYYDEAELPEANLLFILYSEEIQTPEFSDTEHRAFLALVRKTGSDLTVITTIDVTKYITVEMEIPGGFEEMDGSLDIFPLIIDTNVLHLSIGGTLSGSGAVFSLSDVFFLIDSTNNSLSPILELLDTAKFARAGVAMSKYSYTSIYTLNNEQTGTQILTQDYNYERDNMKNIDQGILSPDINVYQYDFDSKKYSLINTISELPTGASLVERSVTFNTECTSGCDQ